MSKKHNHKPEIIVNDIVDEVVEETVIEEPVVEETPEPETPTMRTGVVTNCARLNLRKTPTKAGEIIAVVPAGTELMVDTEKSVPNWYHVWTAGGLEGYCMAEYITI